MTELVPIAEALALVLARARPLGTERVPLVSATGRVLAASARAQVDLPPFASSAMDGFAIRAADSPGTLAVVGRVAAGRPADTRLPPGAAMAIATGGEVPAGADAVVPLETVVAHGNSVEIRGTAAVGENIRPRGGDVQADAEVVAAGVRLGPPQLASLAAAGVAEVECGRRPRVAIVTTGTELRSVGEPLGPGEVYESNGIMLEASLAAAGAHVERFPSVADDEEAHRAAIGRGLQADVLVTTGGVSVGTHDLVRRVERELAVEEVFWGVAMRPGKPMSFGVRGPTLVFGLPGNPVSSLVAAELFVVPAVRALQGISHPEPTFEVGLLAVPVRRRPGRDELLRARTEETEDAILLRPLSGQESHMIARAAAADALVYVPSGEGQLPARAAVRYLRLA